MIIYTSELYNRLINIYATGYDKLPIAQKKRINILNRPEILTLDLYLHAYQDEGNLPPIPPLKDDEEEVKSETA